MESISEDEVEYNSPKIIKRGFNHDEKYKRNVIKNSTIKELPFVNYRGKKVAEKKIGLACK